MALLVHTSYGPSSAYGGTSAAIDTTGAKFIVVVVGAYNNGGHTSPHFQLSDSKGNSYSALTAYTTSKPWCRIYYFINPTVGSGHTWTIGVDSGNPAYASICVAAYDDVVTGFDVENGAASDTATTTIATGSVTPTTSNSLIIGGFNSLDNGAGTITVDNGLTVVEQMLWVSGQGHEGSCLASKYTTSTSALNPTFSIPTGSTAGLGAAIAVFKLASSGVTVNLSGVSAAGALGALAIGASLALSGLSGTTAVGTPTHTASIPVAGVSASAAVGTSSIGIGVTPSGAAGTSALGSPTSGVTISPSGVSASGAQGTETPSVSVTPTGVQGSSALGTIALPGGITLTGVVANGAIGSFVPGTTITFSGASSSSSVGTMESVVSHTPSGVSATGSLGSLSFSSSGLVFALSGIQATHGVGAFVLDIESVIFDGYPSAPEVMLNSDTEHKRQIVRVVNGVLKGKMNAYQDVTLTANAASTTLTDARIGAFSAIIPAMALTANAATSITGGIWVDNLMKGQATIHHASSSNTDQTIRFLIIG